ncbi:MAG: filamentous hemagglutinin N-terminal domain-containing protein, partial [Gammaproteobacteria bacterium]|nr:filamentous hemagglutinin N-terminal domain-containing protein [Gammaproteobacteria bacterium]
MFALSTNLFTTGIQNRGVKARKMLDKVLLILLSIFSGYVLANPVVPDVVHGQVDFSHQDSKTFNITNTPGTIINWQKFSINRDETTRFIQESAASSVLNRVTGQSPSDILGRLLSNGRVFLINPNGIVFGKDAVVDTAGLIASTLDMTNEDFIAGKLKFQGNQAGSINNFGFIKAGANGNIFLIAPDIENGGIIETDGGEIVLAAGESVTIASLDTEDILFEVQAPDHKVVNLGQIITNGGAARMFAGTIKNSGSINADSIRTDKDGNIQIFASMDIEISADATITANGPQGGNVIIESEAGDVLNAGTIEARGSQQAGGRVEILGERVALVEEAQIDISGESGGGEVLIGGDYQGSNPDVKNASHTYVGEDTVINADANT